MRTGARALAVVLLLVVAGVIACSASIAPPGPTHPGADARPRSTPASELAERSDSRIGLPVNPAIQAPRLSGGIGEMTVKTGDPSAVPNSGMRVNVTYFANLPLPEGSSFQVGAEEQVGAYEAVVGFFQNNLTAPIPFFSVFQLSNDSTAHLAYWPTFPLELGLSYEFVLTADPAGTWTAHLNGLLFGLNQSAASFDFGANESTSASNLSFAETAIFAQGSVTPAKVAVPLAFAVRTASGWYLPANATASFSGSPGAQWGVEGRVQHASLAPGTIVTGTGVANVTNGTVLWSGGVAPIRLQLAFSNSTARATTYETFTVDSTDASGLPLPNVAVFVDDSANSTFFPASVETDATGVADGLLMLPNVSATRVDLARVVTTTFGYSGAASASLTIEPAIAVHLASTPASPSGALHSTIDVSLIARGDNGSPVVGLLLALTITGGALLSADTGFTSTSGTVGVSVISPPAVGTIYLNASVDQAGYYGSIVIPIAITPVPPSFAQQYGSYLLIGAGVAIGALVVVLVWRRRGRKKSIPALPIRRYLVEQQQSSPAPSAAGGSGPPASRTPPSGGTP